MTQFLNLTKRKLSHLKENKIIDFSSDSLKKTSFFFF